MTVSTSQRFTRTRPCPVCGGYEQAPRGQDVRCYGFLGDDGKWAHCTRDEKAGGLPQSSASGAYAHRLDGDCDCGARHDPRPRPSTTGSGPRTRIVKTYDYRDEEGQLLFQAVRYSPKAFRQRRPDGDAWAWSTEGIRRVLYRLPELLAADPEAPVFIPEGERDSDRLASFDLVTTTNAMGAKKWREEYNEHLRGRRVVLLEDNDAEGWAHVQQVAASLHGVAASVKIISFRDMAEHADVSDWLDDGHTIEELKALATAEDEAGPAPAEPNEMPVFTPGWRSVVSENPALHGLWRRADEGEQRGLHEALLPEEILEVDGLPVGATAIVVWADGRRRTVFMPATIVTARDPAGELHAATGVALTPEEAKRLRGWLKVVLYHSEGIARAEGLARPRWQDGAPLLPGGALRLVPTAGAAWLAMYGKAAPVDPRDARRAWQEVVDLACGHPRLATVQGAAAGSLYLQPLKRRSFILHITGDSRQGKTLAVEVAMAAYGDPAQIVRSWNTTKIAALERLTSAAILPVALDETAAAGVRDEMLEAILFGAAAGVSRGRGRPGGGLREETEWQLVLLSTGERRLAGVSGLSGSRARIVEVAAPVTPDAETIIRAHELATAHYGWPLTWLREQGPDLDMFRADLQAAEAELSDGLREPILRTLAGHLAVCAAGFRALALWVHADADLDAAIAAGRAILQQAQSTIADEGPSAADRLRQAVFEAEARRDWAYPMHANVSFAAEKGARVEIEGVKMGDTLAVFPNVVQRIARELGIDVGTALRGLRDRGDLIPGSDGKHMGRTVRLPFGVQRMYVFRRPESEADDEW